jgi:hypothetical protein
MSESKTVDLVVDHKLKGVTPEMIDWWWGTISNTERYKLWHPKAHKLFEPEGGLIFRVEEEIGGTLIKTRTRPEPSSSVPVSTTYSHIFAMSVLDDNNKPQSWIIHEYEAMPNGTRMRSTFRLPKGVPQWFTESLRKHNQEEMAHLAKILPELYKKENK